MNVSSPMLEPGDGATPLEPYPQSGAGYRVAAGILELARRLPAALSTRLVPVFEALVRPLPAYVYEVPGSCTPREAGGE